MEEVVKFTYWWTEGLTQEQIKKQLHINPNTAVDWDMFCRETCEVTIQQRSEKIGGEGKVVQIDESKVGKRKYHRVDGQWVFGGIEEDSRRCFIVAVEDRSEATLLPIIKKWIEPGTLIVSDCWKSYQNLEKNGYSHQTVNHSKEFVNNDSYHTNKIEGHWRHMKVGSDENGEGGGQPSVHTVQFPPSSCGGIGSMATPTPDFETSQMGINCSPIGLDNFGNESAEDESLREKIHNLVRDLPSPLLSLAIPTVLNPVPFTGANSSLSFSDSSVICPCNQLISDEPTSLPSYKSSEPVLQVRIATNQPTNNSTSNPFK
ncbi:hypothetical protein ACROYT_G014182 [Oculina patagonica]